MDETRTARENDTEELDKSGTQGWVSASTVGSAPSGPPPSASQQEPPPAVPSQPTPTGGLGEEPSTLGFAFEPPPPADRSPSPSSPERRPRKVSAAIVAAILAAGLVGGGAGSLITNALDDDGTSQTPVSSLGGNPVSGGSGSDSSNTGGSISEVAAAVLPSVVSIEVSTNGQAAEGSGVIISSDGQILTNNHVVAAAADGGQIRVKFNDGRTADAKTLGRDPSSDLAVIKAEGVSGLKPATLGSSANLEVGQQVVAIGSPLGLQGTVTSGIISALNRPVQTSSSSTPFGGVQEEGATFNAIQTDASINPGNSGGPLVDMNGRVIGINSAIASLPQGGGGQTGSIGVGFAIPIDQAKRIAEQLVEGQQPDQGFLGVSVKDATGDVEGAELAQVQSGGPAADAGLRTGDVITKVGDQTIDSAGALVATVRGEAAGMKVTVTYVRDGESHTAEVTLGSRNDSNN